MPINGKTYVGVPGYDSKVQFGVMSYFAYPVDGAGECQLYQIQSIICGC